MCRLRESVSSEAIGPRRAPIPGAHGALGWSNEASFAVPRPGAVEVGLAHTVYAALPPSTTGTVPSSTGSGPSSRPG